MNERDLSRAQFIGGAAMSTRKRKPKAPPLVERFQGPKMGEVLDTAPALIEFETPCRDTSTQYAMDDQESQAGHAWRVSVADRVRAGEVSIEAALDAVHCYSSKVALHQWIRRGCM
jgi:hypothetical protein